jgi:phosphoglycolate phosphatase
MLSKIVEISGIPQRELEPEIRAVHQRHGTSEYTFLIQNLPSLQTGISPKALLSRYQPAIDVYRAERRKVVHPYQSVVETLQELNLRKTLVIAHTESKAFYTAYRLRRTGLDKLLHVLYSPPDHELPEPISEIRNYDEAHYELHLEHRHTPENVHKPDVGLLLDILDNEGIEPEQAVYVGDSIIKDVAMAQEASVLDIHAKYGEAQHTEAYALLRRVSHWTDADVEREKRILRNRSISPKLTLKHQFGELLDIVEFTSFPGLK